MAPSEDGKASVRMVCGPLGSNNAPEPTTERQQISGERESERRDAFFGREFSPEGYASIAAM